MKESKIKILAIEEELKATGKELVSFKNVLAQKANNIMLQKKLTAFTDYITRTNIDHNHSFLVIPILRKTILKATKMEPTAKIKQVEEFLGSLNKHLKKYNELIDAKIEANYQIFKFSDELVCKQYLICFLNNEDVKKNYRDIDSHKMEQIQETEGAPVIYKVFITLKDKDGKIVETIKVMTNRNISWNSLCVSTEFTNGVKHTNDYYKKAIYTYTNKDSDKIKRDSVFSPVQLVEQKKPEEIDNSEIIRLIEIDLTADDIKKE